MSPGYGGQIQNMIGKTSELKECVTHLSRICAYETVALTITIAEALICKLM